MTKVQMQLARSEALRGLGGSVALVGVQRRGRGSSRGTTRAPGRRVGPHRGIQWARGTAPRLKMGPEMASGGRKWIVKRVSFFRALFLQHNATVFLVHVQSFVTREMNHSLILVGFSQILFVKK